MPKEVYDHFEKFVPETDSSRAEYILNLIEALPTVKAEAAEKYADTLAQHVHTEPAYSFLINHADKAKPISTETGLVISKSPEALAMFMKEGYYKDAFISEKLANSELSPEVIIDIFSIILADTPTEFEHIIGKVATPEKESINQKARDFIKEYAGGLVTGTAIRVGCGGAYGRQMQSYSPRAGKYATDVYPNSYLSRLMLHALNYGGIDSHGNVTTAKLPSIEIHVADQPFDPLIPIEYRTDEFFKALKIYNNSFHGEVIVDTEDIDSSMDQQGEIVYTTGPIHFHGSLKADKSVTVARQKLTAKYGLGLPIVVHVEDSPYMTGPELETNIATPYATHERLVHIATQAVLNKAPIVIENNRYWSEELGEHLYHSGTEFANIYKNVVKQTYKELREALPDKSDDELAKLVGKYVGITIDISHLHCAPPHVGYPSESSNSMVTASEKKSLTVQWIAEILEMLDDLAQGDEHTPSIKITNVNLHITQGKDRGKDIHMPNLFGVGTVPNRTGLHLIKNWVERHPGTRLTAITEQSGNINLEEMRALDTNEETAIERKAKITPLEVMVEHQEIFENQIAELQGAYMIFDIPNYTKANNSEDIHVVEQMHDFILKFRQELAGMLDSGPYGKSYIIGAAGDEIGTVIELTGDDEQDKIRSLLLAIDAQLIFLKLMNSSEFTTLKEKQYSSDQYLHIGMMKAGQLYAQLIDTPDRQLFTYGGGASSIKRSAKKAGLRHLLESNKTREGIDLEQLANDFFTNSLSRQETVSTIASSTISPERVPELIRLRNELAKKVYAHNIDAIKIEKLSMSLETNRVNPYEIEPHHPNEVVREGGVLFGRVGGMENLTSALPVAQSDLEKFIRFATTSYIAQEAMTEASKLGWLPREVEYDNSEFLPGEANFIMTKGIFGNSSKDLGANSLEKLMQSIDSMRTPEKQAAIKSNLMEKLDFYLLARMPDMETRKSTIEGIVSSLDISSIGFVIDVEELGNDLFTIVESLRNRSTPHVGPEQMSGNAIPRAGLQVFSYVGSNPIKGTLMITSKNGLLKGDDVAELELTLKALGPRTVHYRKLP